MSSTEPEFDTLRSQFQIMDKIFDSEDVLDNSFDEKILKEISHSDMGNTKKYSMRGILSGIAATMLILISIWAASSLLSPKEVYGTVTNPHVAFAETKKALEKVSRNVKKGITPATKSIKKAETGLEKSKKVNNIKKLNNTSLLLISMTKVTVKYGKS